MFNERGFSEQEVIHEQREIEEHEANDPVHIAQAEARLEAREHRKEERQERRQRVSGFWRRLTGRSRGKAG